MSILLGTNSPEMILFVHFDNFCGNFACGLQIAFDFWRKQDGVVYPYNKSGQVQLSHRSRDSLARGIDKKLLPPLQIVKTR